MRDTWLVRHRAPGLETEISLVCFPHAGGGPSAYAGWAKVMAPRVSLASILLPGREARLSEEPIKNMDALASVVARALVERVDPPWALFGHSFGSVLAFEVARLATAWGRPPVALLVSGRRAPHLGNRRPLLHDLDGTDLLRALERLDGTPRRILGDQEMMAAFLPALKADLTLNETYEPMVGRTLRCPIHAFMGREDSEVTEDELLAWQEVTSGPFGHRVFPGGHFYLKEQERGLAELIEEVLLGSSAPATI